MKWFASTARMTNANSVTLKKSLPNQKPRRKSDPRKVKPRTKQRNPPTETTSQTNSVNHSGDEVDIAVRLFVSLIKKQPQVHQAIVWENFSNRLSEELRLKFEGLYYNTFTKQIFEEVLLYDLRCSDKLQLPKENNWPWNWHS